MAHWVLCKIPGLRLNKSAFDIDIVERVTLRLHVTEREKRRYQHYEKPAMPEWKINLHTASEINAFTVMQRRAIVADPV
jgi:hypothetical protein